MGKYVVKVNDISAVVSVDGNLITVSGLNAGSYILTVSDSSEQ